ncbi:MAG TPA: alpha/beta hydrolase-fold protein [Planctomycetota bacterium]|nr:alpha/beta hydrolase-fold protein [Planctomycetota bacterium]
MGCDLGRRAVAVAGLLALAASAALAGQAVAQPSAQQTSQGEFQVNGPEAEPGGVVLYRIASPYQRGETQVRLLPPPKLDPPEKRRVLFVLPVEAGAGTRWGDAIRAARAAGVADRFGFVAVFPTFSALPWYCDHPAEPTLRQESYVLRVLVPLVERLYPHEARRRALVGFSKSGWGAFSLLLRHPEAFAAAAAWDAPMMMARPGFGMDQVVGTQEQFERYRIERLLRERAAAVRGAERLGLFGYDSFRKDTQAAHALMAELRIPHEYADGPLRKHHWESGWLEGAVRFLRDALEAGATSDAGR